MADIIITIPDAQLARVRNAILAKYPKPAALSDLAWFKEIIRRFIIRIIQEQEEITAVETATLNASNAIAQARATVNVPDNIIQ